MKNNLRFLFMLLLIFSCEYFGIAKTTLAQDKTILILHSYHQEYPWTKNENEGFIETLTKTYVTGNIKFSTEYLDTKRVKFNGEYQDFFYRYLTEKYNNYLPDAIFCTDDNALNFLLRFKNRLFKDVPAVFCGVNNINIQNNLDRKQYTGIFEKKEFIPNLMLIKKIITKPGKILFIGDNSSTHQAIEKKIREDIVSQMPNQKFDFLAATRLSYIIKQLKTNRKGIIFLTTIGGIKDENDAVVPLKKTLESIVSAGDFTIISMEDVYLEKGILGGYVTSGFSQGKEAADITLQLLNGTPASSIPLVKQSPNKYMFNYPQLKKFGLTVSQIPENSIVFNRPQSFYNLYKFKIWSTFVFLLIQTFVIVVLLQNVRSRKKAESELRKSQGRLSAKVTERTSELTKTNTSLKNEIIERKRAEEVLESQNQLMSTLLDNLQVGVFMIEAPDGRPLLANQKAKEILGRGIMDSADKSNLADLYQAFKSGTDQLYPQDELPIVRGLMGVAHSIDDMVVAHPGGDNVYLEVFGSPVKDKSGNVISSLVSFSDITDRKRAEAKLLKEKEFTETALNSQQDTFFLFEPATGKAIRWNSIFSEITGYSDDEIAAMKAPESYYSPEDLERARVFTKKVLKTGPGTIELNLICKNGHEIPTEYSISVINDNNGMPKYFISIGRDISDRKKMEDELRQAHKMESIGTLAGGIAHDFNNILGIIVGNAELALDDLPDGSPSFNNLKEIKIASLRAKDVVRQLLSFSRKTEQEQKPINIKKVVKESIKLIRSSIPSSIEIREKIPEEIDTIFADATQIHQVLINLCTNASHAMTDGEGLLEIILQSRTLNEKTDGILKGLPPGNYVELIVKDSGYGIDPKIYDKIFDPYFTTKEVGKGTGMGLAVVHGIVKNHRGEIYVDSGPEKGTKFTIVFPTVVGQPQGSTEVTAVKPNPSGKETILFVDDESAIVDMAKLILEKLGYRVQISTDPVKALAIFKADPTLFDLVISDMTMPKMSGVKLSKKLREIQNDIPIIICTGHSSLIDEEKAKDVSISAFAMKPITMSEIAKLIRTVLDK